MARSFNGSSDGLYGELAAAHKVARFSWSSWVYFNNVSGLQTIFAAAPAGQAATGKGLILTSSGAAMLLRMGNDSGAFTDAVSGSVLVAGEWLHVAGTYDGASLKLYLGGSLIATTSTSITIAWSDSGGAGPSPGQFYLGAGRNNIAGTAPNNWWLNGRLAECGYWSEALNAAEVTSLYRGFVPGFIRPAALVDDWPLIGRASPEPSRRSSRSLTVVGTTAAAHPRVVAAT